MTKEEVILELAKCEESYPYWLSKYARIIEPPTLENPGGVISFASWPNVVESIKAFEKYRLIAIMKSRQIGESYIVAAWFLWNALFKDGYTALLFSKGEKESAELLGKAKRMWGQLPSWMKLKLSKDSSEEMAFPDRNSVIKSFPATEEAGASFTASLIVCDEWELHPFAGKNYIWAKPTIDAGGQFIGIFTVDKTRPTTLAKTTFVGAPQNGFHALFFPYNVRPGRDEEWYEETKRNIPPDELEGLTPELYMEQNYPRSVEEALRATQTVAAVDLKVLDEMKKRCTSPVSVEGLDPLICKVWQPYQVGQAYIAASDTSHGVGKDYSVTVVMNVRTGVIVGHVMTATMQADEFTEYSVKLLSHFRNPRWYIEDNDNGSTTIDNARKLNYPNLGYQDKEHKHPGWHTGAGNRTRMFDDMVSAFNNWQIQVLDYQGLSQFGTLIRNVDKEGRIEAMKGQNDDYPVAVAICVAKQGEVLKSVTYKSEPIKTLHFAGARR